MANTITTNTTGATTGDAEMDATAPASKVAETRPTGAVGAVWEVLRAAPDGATVAALADASGVSRPTVTKALSELADAGRAVRTPGEGHGRGRTPDLWTPVESAPTTTHTEAPDTGDDNVNQEAESAGGMSPDTLAVAMQLLSEEAERRAAAAEALRRAQAEEAERRARVDAEMRRAEQREEARVMLADLLGVVTTTLAAVAAEDDDQVRRGMEDIARYAGAVRKTTRTGATSGGTGARTGTGERSAPSPLRPLVAQHLHAHPDKEFSPAEIARVLDRSSGAVANALDTLVAQGVAVLTSERPRRFRAFNTATDTDSSATTNTTPDAD